MLLVAKQMEYLNREVLRIQRKAGIAVQICLWSRGRWVPQGWRNNLAGISNIIQYHPISMKWCLIFFHFWSCYMRLYAGTVVSSLFISHITNVSLDMNDFFHINAYEWNIWMHRSICFQKTLYFNKQADMQKVHWRLGTLGHTWSLAFMAAAMMLWTGATPRWQSSTVCRPRGREARQVCRISETASPGPANPCRHETTGFLKDQKEYERRKPESNTTWKPIKQYKDGPSFGIHRFIYSSVWRYWLFLILRSRGVAARVMVLVACN